jgi:ParB/RepB/Spo0J family partition protein
VDPAELASTRNVRKSEVTPEFVGSIKENGVLQPIVATPYGDGLAVIIGNRRVKAAIEAGRNVDVIVRQDLTADEGRIIAQLVENCHREDMRASEIADAYAQLDLLGLDAEVIAAQVVADPKAVRASIALSRMPSAARTAVDKGALTLEDATTLSEFETDPKAYKRLLAAVDKGGNLNWAVADERRKAARAVLRQETAEALNSAGVPMVGEPYGFGWRASKEVGLHRLADSDGVVLTPENHADCPGNAGFFDEHASGDLKATFICRDPHLFGHQVPASYRFLSAEDEAAKAAAELAARERREGLGIAVEVRQEYVRELCRSKKVPKGMTRKVLALLYRLGADEESDETLMFLGAPGEDEGTARYTRFIRRMAEARLPLAILAAVAGRAERDVRQAILGWGDKENAVAWFDFLVAYGYELSDPEVELLADLRKEIAGSRAEDAKTAEAEEESAAEPVDEDSREATSGGHLAVVTNADTDGLDGEDADESGATDREARDPESNEPMAA